jgi:hypothetical protein
MMAVVMLANWDCFRTNRSINCLICDSRMVVESAGFNASPACFTTHLSLIVELRETAFVTAYSIQFLMPAMKADSPFIALGVRWNAKHYGGVTMDQSAERHFCDGCPDRHP